MNRKELAHHLLLQIELANLDEMEWYVKALWDKTEDAPCCLMPRPWAGMFCTDCVWAQEKAAEC